MCLYKFISHSDGKRHDIEKLLETSSYDIVCYKFLKRNFRWWPFSAFTPWRDIHVGFKTLIGKKNLTSGFSGDELINTLCKSCGVGRRPSETLPNNVEYTFGKGLIHTFKNYKDADDISKQVGDKKKIDIWECVIPAGTEYIEGDCSGIGESYGSTEIKFIRRVK